jgi:AraC-like DNA-binding protein/ligand-binding sensor protein
MNGIDLFLEEKVKNLIDSFSYCFKVRITIFSADLEQKLAVGFYPTCSYCRLIREKLGYKNRCLQLDRKMCLRSLNSSGPLSYVCYAGLVDSVFPIKLETAVIGYAMIGQFRTQDVIPAAIFRAWEENGFDPALLEAAFAEQVFLGEEALENMLNLFSMLCDFIVSKGYIRPRHFDIAEEVSRWVEHHISNPILFSDVVDYLGYSQSTILNVLKKRLNMNFKQFCILKKIEYFETVIAENPSLSIEEAAEKVGYSDVSYFSRLYKNVRSITPSAFVKSIRKNAKPSLVSERNI